MKDKLKIYDEIISKCKGFDRKVKTMFYTSANGYMFSQLKEAGEISIRLPKEEAINFMKKHNTTGFKSYGAYMNDYVLIPEELLDKTELLTSYFIKSYKYLISLDPK